MACATRLALAWPLIACHHVLCLLSRPLSVRTLPDGPARPSPSSDGAALPYYDLVIVIPTHGKKDVERRNAIRSSWEQYPAADRCEPCKRHTVKVLFVAGQEGDKREMEEENAKFGDLAVLPDFGQFQFYTHRAEKTQRSLRYALDHYRFKLLLKSDTDAWVFMDRLLDFLDKHKLFEHRDDAPGIYGGNFQLGKNVHPVTNPHAKWYDNVYTQDTGMYVYPTHAKGAGYLLSPDLVEYVAEMGASTDPPAAGLVQGWAHMPKLEDLPSEDVSMGFWLQAVNHTKVDMPVSIAQSACTTDRNKDLVVDHYVFPEDMKRRWMYYVDTGDPCPPRPRRRSRWDDGSFLAKKASPTSRRLRSRRSRRHRHRQHPMKEHRKQPPELPSDG